MKYTCKFCGNEIEMFSNMTKCPYCGNDLSRAIDAGQVIDSIWGAAAIAKKEFTAVFVKALLSVKEAYNEIALEVCSQYQREGLPIDRYDKEYDLIVKSQTRKTLLKNMDNLMQRIAEAVSFVPTKLVNEDITVVLPQHRLNEIKKILEQLQQLIGLRDFFVEEAGNYHRSSLYTLVQLEQFYKELKLAYAKYVRCVNDNNMFAAFPTISNFGDVGLNNDGVLTELFEKIDTSEEIQRTDNNESINYGKCLDELRRSNFLVYQGLLDEDFVPHVDGFWQGLHDMLVLLTTNEFEKIVLPHIKNIDEKGMSTVRRVIADSSFDVNESKMQAVYDIVERLSKDIA